MNKYFYAIKKLKIKPWIKYWLIKQTEFKGVLSDILEGISFYLTDSLNMKFKMFKIYGRTTQDGDPTPENPVPIKNTGDNGSVNEKVQNKNYADYTKVKGTYQTTVSLIENGFKVVGNYAGSLIVSGLKKNTTYYLSYIRENITSSVTQVTIYNADASTAIKQLVSSGTFNTGNNTTVNIWFYAGQGTSKEANFTNIQVSEGSTPTPYVPHAEQNLSFPLAQGQKFYEGSYPDDDEKVHHKWGEVVLDGTETGWTLRNTNTNTGISTFYINVSNLINYKYDNSTKYALCNRFIVLNKISTASEMFDLSEGISFMYLASTTNRYLYVNIKGISNLADFLTWLSTYNLKIQYKLAEETTEDFTEEQKTAWKEWQKARTYKNVTHISSEDETPAELKIQYWKEV